MQIRTVSELVAWRIRQLRLARGETQAETAERLRAVGVKWGQARVSATERSVGSEQPRSLTIDDVLAAARAFDVPVSALLAPPTKADDCALAENFPTDAAPLDAADYAEFALGDTPEVAEVAREAAVQREAGDLYAPEEFHKTLHELARLARDVGDVIAANRAGLLRNRRSEGSDSP